jgi:hypothetical protein
MVGRREGGGRATQRTAATRFNKSVSTNRFQQIGFNKSGNLPGAVRHSSRIAAPADGPDAGGDVGAQIVESGTDDAGTSSLTRGCTGAHALVQVEKFT